jgi:hypothetical protein
MILRTSEFSMGKLSLLPIKVGTIHVPIADIQDEIQNRCRTYNQRIKKDVEGTTLHNCELTRFRNCFPYPFLENNL